MKLSHTPGPWHTGSTIRTVIFAPDGYAIADAKTFHNMRQADTKANARLIAAAPDLLAALHAIMLRAVRQQANGGGLHDFQDCSRACADTARAAIAKATGEGAK